jgi:hypothetical protein
MGSIIPAQNVHLSDCNDAREYISCLVEDGYSVLVKDYPKTGRMIRFMDAIWINLSQLYGWIGKLDSTFIATKHNVLRVVRMSSASQGISLLHCVKRTSTTLNLAKWSMVVW